MRGFGIRCAVLAVLGTAMWVSIDNSTIVANADDDAIKVAMKKINGGKISVCKTLGDGVKSSEPKWDELAEKSKIVVPLAKAMVKAKPPKGDDESWEKFSTAYAKAAQDLDAAIGKKDGDAAKDAMKTISDCRGCHMAHRILKKKQ